MTEYWSFTSMVIRNLRRADMILYKKRRKYKYSLHCDVTYPTGISVDNPISFDLLGIDIDGNLVIRAGYSWDGPSGPTIDTKNFMRGSLIHDGLYQLIRESVLSEIHRQKADEIMRDICIEDGMSKIRAFIVYKAVRAFGARCAKPDLLSAPASK